MRMNISISVPSRGKAGEPGSLDAKQKRDTYFRNQRSLAASLRGRKNRNVLRNKNRYIKKSLKSQLKEQNISSSEIKIKLHKSRMGRRSSARDRHLYDGLHRPDRNEFASNSLITNSNVNATRDYFVSNQMP